MSERIAEILKGLEEPGVFATRLRAAAADLAIEVRGAGPLRLPVSQAAGRRLRTVARPAPFGLRDRTLHDARVRDTWEIARSRVKIDGRRWNPVLAGHLERVRQELGFPDECRLRPVLDKLLLYEEGQFFKTHQDSEKSDGMVASLVVVLPSEYSGGALKLEHGGATREFRRVKSQAKELSLLAFYADCHHELTPIRSGIRVALTYHLMLEDGAGTSATARPPGTGHGPQGQALSAPRADPDAAAGTALMDALAAHFERAPAPRFSGDERRPPERLVYLLDHEYTRRSLEWSRLKGSDRVRARTLRAAADSLDLRAHLALADVHEVWMCEPGYDAPRRSRFWHTYEDDEREDEDHDPSHPPLGELGDSDVELHHWIDLDGTPSDGVGGSVRDDELCFTKPSVELSPFESEYEGWQGNYGNTVERWYHRAALVLWPRQKEFVLRARASTRWAIEQLSPLAAQSTQALEAQVRELLPIWAHAGDGVEDARVLARWLKTAARISDPALASEFVVPMGMRALGSRTTRAAFVRWIEAQGLASGEKLLAAWTERRSWQSAEWLAWLPEICEALASSSSPQGSALARWLVRREAERARAQGARSVARSQPWLDLDGFAAEVDALAHVLAATVAIGDRETLEAELEALAHAPADLPLVYHLQVLRNGLARSPALARALVGSRLFELCVEELDEIVSAPGRAEDDWSLDYRLSCTCGDCQHLGRFLRGQRTGVDWPLNKQRRMHLHRAIDEAELPVRHTTLRRGRPFVLQLRKDPSLFTREARYRSELERIAQELRSLR